MDRQVRTALLGKLRGLAARPPSLFGPGECGYCGGQAPTVKGALCAACLDFLARLEETAARTEAASPTFTRSVRVP